MTAGKVHFVEKVNFIGNNAERTAGGALYLLSFSQLRLLNDTDLSFVDNTGRYDICLTITNGHFIITVQAGCCTGC